MSDLNPTKVTRYYLTIGEDDFILSKYKTLNEVRDDTEVTKEIFDIIPGDLYTGEDAKYKFVDNEAVEQ
ncbi:MAG: hypothetical protein JRL30_27710 [Deltaproteobacteria bacterium]|nr:hypothetical protein [Deltaproteobacteria bacterium]